MTSNVNQEFDAMMQLNSGCDMLQLNSGDLMELVGSDTLMSSLTENHVPTAAMETNLTQPQYVQTAAAPMMSQVTRPQCVQTAAAPMMSQVTRPQCVQTTAAPMLSQINTQTLVNSSARRKVPYAEITEQPRAKGMRFRYECEGRSAGSIPGEKSTNEKKTYPALKIHNYTGREPAVVVVSCVSKDDPAKPHPHALVGKDCDKGVCTVKVKDSSNPVTFPHLGIQCVKKKKIEASLEQRKKINVDPFRTGFDQSNHDLYAVRLCFQVFLPIPNKIHEILTPVCSQVIQDKKATSDLVICRVDRTSGKPRGGDEVFLLCEKVNKEDIQVRFFQESDEAVPWEKYADFGQGDVHRQFAIVFKTPPYKDLSIHKPVQVLMQLKRMSDQEVSESIPFTYMPEDPDPDRIDEKRRKKNIHMQTFSTEPLVSAGSSDIFVSNATIKERLKLKASRRQIKQEAPDELPSYSAATAGSTNIVQSNAGVASSINYRSMAHATVGKVTIDMTASRQAPMDAYFPTSTVTANNQQQLLAETIAGLSTGNINANNSNVYIVDPVYPVLTQGVAASPAPMPMMSAAERDMNSTDLNVGSSDYDHAIQTFLNDMNSQDVGAPVMSFGETVGGLSGDLLMSANHDQNVAAMENVASSDHYAEVRRALDSLQQ